MSNSNVITLDVSGLLLVLFVALKLTGLIAWSWWWVLCPIWAPLALAGIVLAGAAIVLLLAGVVFAITAMIEGKK